MFSNLFDPAVRELRPRSDLSLLVFLPAASRSCCLRRSRAQFKE